MIQEQSTDLVDQPVIERPPQTRLADPSNHELVRNVHPEDWVNPQPAGRYNLVVLGARTAGLVTAAGAAGLGGQGRARRARPDMDERDRSATVD